VIVPPEFGYTNGEAPAGIGDGDTLIFVIDILGIE
jgi:peptidylprolyl isomerase